MRDFKDVIIHGIIGLGAAVISGIMMLILKVDLGLLGLVQLGILGIGVIEQIVIKATFFPKKYNGYSFWSMVFSCALGIWLMLWIGKLLK